MGNPRTYHFLVFGLRCTFYDVLCYWQHRCATRIHRKKHFYSRIRPRFVVAICFARAWSFSVTSHYPKRPIQEVAKNFTPLRECDNHVTRDCWVHFDVTICSSSFWQISLPRSAAYIFQTSLSFSVVFELHLEFNFSCCRFWSRSFQAQRKSSVHIYK